MPRKLLALAALALASASAHAQTLDDGLMMPRTVLCTGFVYGHDRWSDYWEGTLERDNGNIGTVKTESIAWMGTYGLRDDLNLIAMVPYVRTRASAGVLHGQKGVQDLTVGAKYRVFSKPVSLGAGRLDGFAVASYGRPLTDYNPDFLPLSIGLHSQRLSGRGTLYYRASSGWFGEATAAYTWRGRVTLDRISYFTNGEMFMSNEVSMPDVFDYAVRAGFHRGRFRFPVTFTQQVTRGGGDIRRQDMPFVSNKMDASRVVVRAEYDLPKLTGLSLKLDAARTVAGRNVSKSTTFMGGLMYTLHF
jgi:hypothetical protein